MTLKELKALVTVTDDRRKPPKWKELRTSDIKILASKTLSGNGELTVYENGYVLYREDNRYTVFPIHQCTGYEFESVNGEVDSIGEDLFDNEEWHVRLLLEGADRMAVNQINTEKHHNLVSSDLMESAGKEIQDLKQSPLEKLIEEESFEERIAPLKERQKDMVRMYYAEGMKQEDISKVIGMKQQNISANLKKALKVIEKNVNTEEKKKK